MKKMVSVLLALLLCTAMLGASAESAFNMNDLAGQTFVFASGVGGWSTELYFAEDGTFTGSFHDSEMGAVGEEYPNGTIYICGFSGKMSAVEQVNEHTWRLKLDELVINAGESCIDDGVLFEVVDTVYGLENPQELLLYLPGTPVSELPEELLFWLHLHSENMPEVLPFCAIYNVAEDCGFAGEMPIAE